MIKAAEVAYAAYGAWRLARFDASGIEVFGNTVEAFWRSFYAAVIVAPAYAVLLMLHFAEREIASGPLRIALVELSSYTIAWVAFPLAMFHIAERISRGDRYLRYITAHNWANLLQVALYLAVAGLIETGLLGFGAAAGLTFAAQIVVMIYLWFIAHVGLDIKGRAAAAVVFLDLLIGIVLTAITSRML